MKQQIINLRNLGKSYNEISLELGCSKSTVSYHLGLGQKVKSAARRKNNRSKNHPYLKKISNFRDKYLKHNTNLISSTISRLLYSKVYKFTGGAMSFTFEDVINKYGLNPKCYLTGDTIDVYSPSTYHFDHIIPVSRGGSNELDNLGICTKQANLAKSNMTPDELKAFCQKVINNLS